MAACLLLMASLTCMGAYTPRDFLQKAATKDQLKAALILDQKWVKYPAYQNRNAWDALFGEVKADLIAKGETYLDYPWTVVKATDYLAFQRDGNRVIMENPFGKDFNALAALFWAEMAEGKGRFLDQLINGTFRFCEMTTWSLSAHLSLQKNSHTFPDHLSPAIDLRVGDMGSLLAWIHYFFRAEFDQVDPLISQRLRYELKRQILDPYLDAHKYWWQADKGPNGRAQNNWNPWCNFNVLTVYMLMEEDLDRLYQAVYYSMYSVDQYINFMQEDGGCDEGPSYWSHAAGKMYDYLQLLSDVTGGKINVFDQAMIKNMGEYIARSYIGDGWVVNFADASARGGGSIHTIFAYGQAVQSPIMKGYAAYLLQRAAHKAVAPNSDVFRSLQALDNYAALCAQAPVLEHPQYSWFPQTGFCYMTDAQWFFATKAGHNDESHNHNDIGSFILYRHNKPFFVDAGVGTYTRQTFSSERYRIWTMQSQYHSLPLINGQGQRNGRQYQALDATFSPKAMTFSVNLAGAYPQEAQIRKWTRAYSLKNGALTLRDNFDLAAAQSPNRIHFLTWAQPQAAGPGVLTLEVEGEKVSLHYNAKQFEATVEPIQVDDPRLSTVWGNKLYRIVLTAKATSLKGSYTFTIK